MDGHWEWSEGGDDADTADLGDQHGDFGAEHYGDDFGGEHLHGGFDGGDGHDGHDAGPGHELHDDLEEPLGTEHAAADYDHALEHGDHDEPLSYDEDHHHADPVDGDPAAGGDGHEAAFGTDPDTDPTADDPAWHEAHFPEELHLSDPPEPVDGFPWTDADVLGGPGHDLSAAYDPAVAEPGAPDVTGLVDYAGDHAPAGTDPWSLLLGSEDPATSSLATFWAPQ